MIKRLNFQVTSPILVMSLLLFANSFARQVAGIVAISGVFSGGGANEYLVVLLIDYLIILFTSGLQSLIVDRVNRVNLTKWILAGFAASFLILRILFLMGVPDGLLYSVMYILAEQQLIFFPLVFWVLANDVFDMAQAKKVFPVISGWGFMGTILGVSAAAFSPILLGFLHLPAEEVLTFNVVIYLLAFGIISFGMGHIRLKPRAQAYETVRETLTEGWGFIREVLSFRYLSLAILILALCDTIIEYRFLGVMKINFPTQGAYQSSFSLFRLGVTVLSFLVQALLTARIMERIQLKNTFFFFPVIVLGGALVMIASPGLIAALGVMGILKLNRETVDASARKAFQGLVPAERRGRVSTFMDSYLPAVGTIAACLLLLGINELAYARQMTAYTYLLYLSITAVGGAVCIWLTARLRKVYEMSLLNWRLKRRQRGGSVLDKIDF